MRAWKTVLLAVAVCSGPTGVIAAQSFGFATFSAEIRANGATRRGVGIQGSARTGLGIYRVSFTRNVTVCAIVASPSGKVGGQISVVKTSNNPDRIRVYTFSRTGQPTNLEFTVFVSCTS